MDTILKRAIDVPATGGSTEQASRARRLLKQFSAVAYRFADRLVLPYRDVTPDQIFPPF